MFAVVVLASAYPLIEILAWFCRLKERRSEESHSKRARRTFLEGFEAV